jgi:hypothetical protein
MRKKIFKGSWIYFSILALLFLGLIHLKFRQSNVLKDEISLLEVNSQYAFHRTSPCFEDIYGEPNISPKDDFIKISITCPDGLNSTNTLAFSALKNYSTVSDIITLLSKINNFDYNPGKLIIGDLNHIKWQVLVNNKNQSNNITTLNIKPKDIIEIKYE